MFECSTLHTLILFLGTVVIWGSTWIAIAMQVGPVPVLVSVFYRFAVAALVLIVALAVTRRLERPALRHQPFLIAQAITFAVGQPADVDVGEIIVRPTAQS